MPGPLPSRDLPTGAGTPPSAPRSGHAWSGTLSAVLLAGLLVFLADGVAFRSGLYDRIAEPQSMGGRTTTLAYGLEQWQPRRYAKTILLLGDSRTQENVSARGMEAAFPGRNVEAQVAALPGTELVDWILFLREVDPDADRFTVIAFGVSDYDARSWDEYPVRDQHFAAALPLLRFSDRPLFRSGEIEPAGRARARLSFLLKGYGYRRDVQDLVNAPLHRREDAAWWRAHVLDDARNYAGMETSLAGARYDRATEQVAFPPGYPAKDRAEVTRYVRRGPPPYRHAEYERRALARLLAHYEGSGTRLVFYRQPRLPFVDESEWPSPDPASPLREAAAAGRVTLLPDRLFAPLESPEFFADALHLNRNGRAELTRTLAASLPIFGD